jgi:DNA-binding MarR family transcriptional regulator
MIGRSAADMAAALQGLVMRIGRIARQGGAQSGLGGPRLSALAAAARHGPISLAGLAAVEKVSAPTMTRVVEALVRDGLVTREPDPANRRTVRIAATEAGRRQLGSPRGEDALVRRLDQLADSEQRALARGLEILERVVR